MPVTRSATSPVQLYSDFRREHPGTAIPADYLTERGFHLGRWQDRQRVARMLDTLPPQRIAQLDAIGFVWSDDNTPLPAVSRADSKRRRMLTEIAAYREEHGNALVPANYVTHDGEQVGQWLYRAVKKWRADTLPDEERGPLAVLGVSPNPRPRGPRTPAQRTGSAVRHPGRRSQARI
ncbi:helicase associated domain-containing protein [Rhodococcus tibetensis]|uniref:Helicase associated domain-containing protein n=1 Tax=Rhodococcus tibetensis TaxID=2965064 RepID=A0ABT1QIV4_9NOCA|nr:helicase associated domain-containing protein [Rhodococcus sp. FXJ9.536]MCQ4121015.1 helicase associated domain-containing protein [Rhodococcus sp. FXJ9.536]